MSKNMKITQTGQYAPFLKASRALGCHKDEAAFDDKLKGIARQEPEAEPPAPKA